MPGERPRQPFSRRHGYAGATREIAVREDAPEEFRAALLQIAIEVGLGPGELRRVACRVLRMLPNPLNWSAYPNMWEEVQGLVLGCDWFRVYDITEAIYQDLVSPDRISQDRLDQAAVFEGSINDYFREAGIGWQLVDGEIRTRGSEAFESAVLTATEELDAASRPTASREIHEALQDLSRRPDADLTGAIHHAMGALEAVARDVTGESTATLGRILNDYPHLVPPPLDNALGKVWGYASNAGRHILEGHDPRREEAELIVGLAAAVVTYLNRRMSSN